MELLSVNRTKVPFLPDGCITWNSSTRCLCLGPLQGSPVCATHVSRSKWRPWVLHWHEGSEGLTHSWHPFLPASHCTRSRLTVKSQWYCEWRSKNYAFLSIWWSTEGTETGTGSEERIPKSPSSHTGSWKPHSMRSPWGNSEEKTVHLQLNRMQFKCSPELKLVATS